MSQIEEYNWSLKELKAEKDRIVTCLEQSELTRKKCQSNLRKFVTNKEFSIDERFEVWSKYCDKLTEGGLINKGEFGCLGQMVDDCFPTEQDRYRDYDWEHFYKGVEEAFALLEECSQDVLKYVKSLD